MTAPHYADPAAEHPAWEQLLRDAVQQPGTISQAYSAFHSYSLGNQLLALFQCAARGLRPGPIATFMRWKELGRSVRKGEKALTLCQPRTYAQRTTDDEEDPQLAVIFTYRRGWFVLSQTDGDDYTPAELPCNLKKIEAESVALLCSEALGLDGAAYARGYVQSWLQGESIPEASARRIFSAADKILRAGRPEW